MKFIRKLICLFLILGILLNLLSCNKSKENQLKNIDLNLKSNSKIFCPIGDDSDINKNITINIADRTNEEIIKGLITTLFERYKVVEDITTTIEDYKIYKIDTVLEINEGAVFGVIYSVRNSKFKGKWYVNNTDWSQAMNLYCSYINDGDKYTLNIIGDRPIYYNNPDNKLKSKEIAKILFEKDYLYPRIFDEDYGKGTSYNIEEVIQLNDDSTAFSIKYSVQGRPWVFTDEENKIAYGDRKLIKHGDFYQIVGSW